MLLGLLGAFAGALLFFFAGWILCAKTKAKALNKTERATQRNATKLIEEMDRKRRSQFLEEKKEWYKERTELEENIEAKSLELTSTESALIEKEGALDEKSTLLGNRESAVKRKMKEIKSKEAVLEEKGEQLAKAMFEYELKLEKTSMLSVEEAKRALLEELKSKAELQVAEVEREIVGRAHDRAEREAKKIIALAIERCASEQATQLSVSVVSLPSDRIKGRIVGREGRNIRAFETATGVKVIVNDTPEAIVLSSFDPIKREAAKIAMQRLVVEGKINPKRVGDVVKSALEDVSKIVVDEGTKVLEELNIQDVHPEIASLLGKLKFRTSYGQSVLEHSKEAALLAGVMASELGLDGNIARRAGLFHDIGKAVDHEMEGTHVEIGLSLAKRYGEPKEVQDAIVYHHEEAGVDSPSPIAFLIAAADAISAARPGARMEDPEKYIKRIKDLEALARTFPGVRDAYAINAGREIRVLVTPKKIGDQQTWTLASEIAGKIRSEMTYSGEVKVNVIRQTKTSRYTGRSYAFDMSPYQDEEIDDEKELHDEPMGQALSSHDTKGSDLDLQASSG